MFKHWKARSQQYIAIVLIIVFVALLIGYNFFRYQSFLGINMVSDTYGIRDAIFEHVNLNESNRSDVLTFISNEDLSCGDVFGIRGNPPKRATSIEAATTGITCNLPPIWVEGKLIWNLFNPAKYVVGFYFDDEGTLVYVSALRTNYFW